MTESSAGVGSSYERELLYYRRECNDLGARLLRLQEEQSQAFREARRSRTVVKLVREAYRLGDPARTAHDVGGPILEAIVDNVLCDRAALLREEPLGSGRFLIAHAIGRPDTVPGAEVVIHRPPTFFYSAGHAHDPAPKGLLEVLGLPYALWAYDPSSGQALVIGNRMEGNVSRPFEAGDQELIESALSIYLDVLYRKHAEAQLRHAKQAAEEAGKARASVIETLSQELGPALQGITEVAQEMDSDRAAAEGTAWFQDGARQIATWAARLTALTRNAMRLAMPEPQASSLDVEWVSLDDVLRTALQFAHDLSTRTGVDLSTSLPQRRITFCVDRIRMQRALRILVNGAVARAERGSQVRVTAGRRSDGGLEIVVSTPTEVPTALDGLFPGSQDEAEPAEDIEADAARIESVRDVISAHGGLLVMEARPRGGIQTRIILPAQGVREDGPVSVSAL
jgi:K+-sensing histidine kinase KdpD